MVLSHSTGFPNWRSFEPDKRLKYLFTPGAQYSYSGEGYALLQMVVEQITGRDLETLARQKVFEPLGMTRTSYVWQEPFPGNAAQAHDQYGRTHRLLQLSLHRSAPDAAGSMIWAGAASSRNWGQPSSTPAMTSAAKTPPPEPLALAVDALILIMVITAALVTLLTSRKRRADPDAAALRARRPQGFWTGAGAAVGLALGVLLGVIFGHTVGVSSGGVVIGAVLGIATGAFVGAILERRHRDEARPLTKDEKRARRWMIGVGVVALVPLIAVAAVSGAALLLLR